ncbi:MAG: hypothetical protein IPK69_02570 [Phycisphaerales bacterium]|nr:MAG: hypothetical protein IPK69_02570 [Phycisphaerales bacterium]
MSKLFTALIGPRIPPEELHARRWRYLTPTLIFMAARVLLLVSIFFPYWHMGSKRPSIPTVSSSPRTAIISRAMFARSTG